MSCIRRYRRCFTIALSIFILSFFIGASGAFAHSPHDHVDALEVSPDYEYDKTLLILVSGHLLRSTDGGHSWKELTNGLNSTDPFSKIAFSPDYENNRTVLVSTEGSGIYKSRDGGESWAQISNGLGSLDIGSMMFLSADTVIAAGIEGGLYISEDNGENWARSMQSEVPITTLARASYTESGYIYAADGSGVLHVSKDGGNVWERIYRFEDSGVVTSLSVSAGFGTDKTLFAGTERRGIFKSTDGGISFEEKNDGLGESYVVDVGTSPHYASDSTVFASTWYKAIYRSEDGGENWQLLSQGLTTDEQANTPKYKLPHFGAFRYAGDTLFLGGFDGLFRSTDGGATWAERETQEVGLIRGLGVSPGESGQAAVAISTYGGGAYVSYDKGKTWLIKNRGLTTTRLSDIVFSPQFDSDSTMFSGAQGALLRSAKRDDGWERIALEYHSWPRKIRRKIVSALTRLGVSDAYARKILTKKDIQLVYPTAIAVSPDFANDGTVLFGTRWHGIYKSTDGGETSEPVWDAQDKVVPELVISPDFSNDNTVFANVRDIGVYRSSDGGRSWQPVNKGMSEIMNWEVSELGATRVRDILLAISPAYKTDKTLFAATSTGIYTTTDSGDHWLKLPGLPAGYVIGLAISPDYQHDTTLLVSLKGKGLYKTSDGGGSFSRHAQELITRNYAIELIAFSGGYASDRTIYAASDEELFISGDGGESWQRVARPVRYEDIRDVLTYQGDWQLTKGAEYSASSVTRSAATKSQVTLPFVGTGVSWVGRQSNRLGIASVYVDNVYQGQVDQYSDKPHSGAESFAISNLPYGAHTITVEVTGKKNPSALDSEIVVDAFDIIR